MVFVPRWERYKDKKPTGLVEVDYGHELSKNLKHCYFFGNLTNNVDLVTNTSSGFVGTNISNVDDGVLISGSFSYINLGILPISDFSEISILLKYKDRTSGDDFARYFGIRYAGSDDIRLYENSTVLTFAFDNGSSTNSNISPIIDLSNEIVLTHTGSRQTGFRNGSFVVSASDDCSFSGFNGLTYIGSSPSFSSGNIRATFERFLVFDKALSEDEVFALYEAPYQILKPRKTFFTLTQSSGVIVTGAIAANAASISATTTVTRKASGELGIVKAFIVDESGNALVDELGNAVTGYEYAQADIAAVVQLGDNIIANLSANDASVSATATVTRQASGSLTAHAADLATTTRITRKASGSLTANAADVTATATLGSNLSAALSANNSSVSATTTVIRHANGTFNASVAGLNSNIAITRKASGGLDASSAILTGSGTTEGAVAGSGALQATDSQIVGSVALIRTATGALVPVAADIAASVTVTGTQEITGSGSLVAGNATMSNSVDRPLYLSDIPAIVDAVWADKRALTLAKYLGLK